MTIIKDISKQRAMYGFKYAEEGHGTGKNIRGRFYKVEKYDSYIKKLPMLIKENTLGAALAFFCSKGKTNEPNAYNLIYDQIKDWFLEYDKNCLFRLKKNDCLMKTVIGLDSSMYRAVTIETLAITEWIIRFSDGYDD